MPHHRNYATRLTALLLSLFLSACGPLPDDDSWELNDDVGEQIMGLACPKGGKVTPKTPAFGKSIEGYISYVAQSKCSPTAKPGVVAFKNLILATYPCTYSGGITRSCSVGGKSEHKEGRAWDWMVKVGHPAADSVLKWLLATDKYGNKHANARRLGIMYMIFNKKIWGSYNASKGWRSYSGSNPHTDHVHFSFGWPGANKATGFWKAPMPPQNQPPQGWMDGASCSEVRGWAQDPDAKSAAISVHIYLDGKASDKGAKSYNVKADQYRSDLCKAIGSCKHGFVFKPPPIFLDGKPHTVRAYGIDTKGGTNPQLQGCPKTITCKPPAPPPPPPPPPPKPDLTAPTPDAGSLPDTGPIHQSPDRGAAPPAFHDGAQPGADLGPLPPAAVGTGYQLYGGCTVGSRAGTGTWLVSVLTLLGLVARRRRERTGAARCREGASGHHAGR